MFEDGLFQPDQITPEGQETKVVELTAAPYNDRRRVGVTFRLSPFNSPPSARISIIDSQERELASSELINILHLESEITLHLPADGNQPGEYQVFLQLFRLEDDETEADQNPQIKQIDLHSISCSFLLR